MQGRLAAMVFTDPPYNVPVAGHVSGLGRAQHTEFAMASGEMAGDDFQVFLERAFDRLAMHSDDGSIHFVCMDWRHMAEIVAAGQSVYSELKNVCVWDKGHGGMGSLYRSQHELVFVFKAGKRRHRNNVDLGRFGRTRTNVWRYPGLSSFGSGRDETLAMHPTVKPVAMVADAMLDCSKRKDIVLDPFCGSGTTILAAEKTGRTACAIEFEPKYVDTAIERWEKLTGEKALLDGTDWTFDDIGHERNDGDCLRPETA